MANANDAPKRRSLLQFVDLFKSGVLTKDKLVKRAQGLEAALNCVDNFECLRDTGGYRYGKPFPYELYKNGLQQRLVELWMAEPPSVHVIDGVGHSYSASHVGREFAKFLRVRNQDSAFVFRVYVKDQKTSRTRMMMHILGSLIWNLISLAPGEFEASEDLSEENFERLMSRGRGGFDAGLKILESLPPLDIQSKKLLLIVDGMDLAEDNETVYELRRLAAVLRDVVAKNNGHLLYTLGNKSRVV